MPDEKDSLLPQHFGKTYVRVEDPERLFGDLKLAIGQDPKLQQNPPEVDCGPVRYDYGMEAASTDDIEQHRRWACLQKPERYSDEREYRFWFWFSFAELIGKPSHYSVVVPHALDYCDIL